MDYLVPLCSQVGGPDGLFLPVPRSAVLTDYSSRSQVGAMTEYFKTYAEQMDLSMVRWVKYKDWATRTVLVAACVALADKTTAANDYLGVVCMDINIVARVSELQQVAT